jgi:pimeloyl-ACP methyl ester carboxylesterase
MPQVTPPGQPVRLFFAESGPRGGPPVVLLHGFPQFSYGWRCQLPALGAAGLRAIAPDLRGYGRSPKPPAVRDYGIDLLASDVVDLIRRECGGRAHVVGHDWGGIVAWWLAMHHPDAVDRLVILNAPHPAAYLRELRRTPSQVLRSWYVLFFQLPWLPEVSIRAFDFATLRRLFRDEAAPYVAAFSDRRSLTGAINYYRAAFRAGTGAIERDIRSVRAPTLVIWGDRDRYLVPQLADGLEQWVPDVRVVRLPHAGHWLQHDHPQRVNRLLVDFLRPSHPADELTILPRHG